MLYIKNKNRKLFFNNIELDKEVLNSDLAIYFEHYLMNKNPNTSKEYDALLLKLLKQNLNEFFNRNYSWSKIPKNRERYPLTYSIIDNIKSIKDFRIEGERVLEIE